MSYPIYLSVEALSEATQAYLYYDKQLEGLGERFLREVEEYMTRIAAQPTFYSYSDETKTIRDVALRLFPFSIIYEIKDNRIDVYHIHHAKKNLP